MEKELYRRMLRIRRVEEKIAERYAEQKMRCPVHLSIGQEAAAVGVCAALKETDWAFGTHRSHAHYLAKGGDLNAFLAELYGRATGCSGGKGGSMHLIDRKCGFMGATPIVAATIPIAVGAAWGGVMRGDKRLVVSFFGDAAVEEGVFHEAANFAALKKLPILLACENNGYSVYSPFKLRQPEGRRLHKFAASYGMKSFVADGNDVLKTLAVAKKAVAAARKEPVFLEIATYRWREHCGPAYDDQLGYRPKGELARWQKADAVLRSEARLKLKPAAVAALTMEIDAEIDAAFAFADASPWPKPEDLNRSVYA